MNSCFRSCLLLLVVAIHCQAFTSRFTHQTAVVSRPAPLIVRTAYVRQEEGPSSAKKKKSLHPKIGDIVRYYDLDGGFVQGEVFVGKITFIQSRGDDWTVDLLPLEDVGDGYYAEYSSRKRRDKGTLRPLSAVSPIMASYVQSEDAFKVPMAAEGVPKVRADQYDVEDYTGPVVKIDAQVVATDLENYTDIKTKILKFAALTGLAGTVVVDLVKGTEDALIYFAGAVSSLLYLFLLSVKTDTIASADAKLGKNVSNLRFAMPLLVLVGVALYNRSLGDDSPVAGMGAFDFVTAEQFGAAIVGFLTYRLPLFVVQLQEAFKGDSSDDELSLPGSAGIALKMARGSQQVDALPTDDLSTVFLISGPQATGRTELVKKLIADGDGRFVGPDFVDKVIDPATYERLEQRGDLLSEVDGRYGITAEKIRSTAKRASADGSVLVVDADVELSKQLTRVPGLRLVGVWVGLNSVDEFEKRIGNLIDSGDIEIIEDETRESTIRNKIREVVKEIEYGITSGIFEFTVLNKDEVKSMKELMAASEYCF